MDKRVKITFESVNKGLYTEINYKFIAESNARIKKEMEPKIREHIRKQILSERQASNLIVR